MTTKTELLEAVLIDPFKKELRRCRVADDLATWYELLGCSAVDRSPIASDERDHSYLDIWFDDEFLYREPPWPAFRLFASGSMGSTEHILHGYGLVLASRNGETRSLSSSPWSVEKLRAFTGLCFEKWEERMPETDCLDQLLRTPELELPGRFEFID